MKIDYYFDEFVLIWMKPYYSYGYDLDFVKCKTESIGIPPEWYSDYIAYSGLDSIIDAPSYFNQHLRTNLMWCLKQGIAPKQPFCIKFYKPEYHTDYWGETDETIRSYVYAREKIFNAADNWSIVLDKIKKHTLQEEINNLINKKIKYTSYKNWYISRQYNHDTDDVILILKYKKNDGDFGDEILRQSAKYLEDCKKILLTKISVLYPELTTNDILNIKWG